jgi:hypothetical protein
LLTVTSEIAMRLFPSDDKTERDQDHTDVFEPHEIKPFFRYRNLWLELVNEMRKGVSSILPVLLLDTFACIDDGGAS